MSNELSTTFLALADVGWSPFFAEQLEPVDTGMVPVRVSVVHRSHLMAETSTVTMKIGLQPGAMDVAVGDWVLTDPATRLAVRRLERKTLLSRRSEGARIPQLIAAKSIRCSS